MNFGTAKPKTHRFHMRQSFAPKWTEIQQKPVALVLKVTFYYPKYLVVTFRIKWLRINQHIYPVFG